MPSPSFFPVMLSGGTGLKAIRQAYITSGNITLPATAGAWAPVAGVELAIPAAVGDWVEISPSFMWQPVSNDAFLDLGATVGASTVRYGSTGTGTPAVEGDPAMYFAPGTYGKVGAHFAFQVTAPDLDAGNVRFTMNSAGTVAASTLYASGAYPYRWIAKNYGAVA